jgi:dolichol-phosphate mannosyltransferase
MGAALPKQTESTTGQATQSVIAADPRRIAFAVVVPCFNEAPNLKVLVPEIYAALRDEAQPFQVVIVDDASDDDTAEVLARLQTCHPNLLTPRHGLRGGQSRGIWTGLQASAGDWIVTLDGDGQNDPADIPRLLAAARGDDSGRIGLVQGIRTRRKDTLSKRWASKFANWLRGSLLKDDCPDTGCGLKVVRREVYEALPYFDSRHRFMPALVKAWGWEVRNLPVNHRPRREGASKYTNWRRGLVGIVDLAGVIWLIKRTRRPLVEPAGAAARPQAGRPQAGRTQAGRRQG